MFKLLSRWIDKFLEDEPTPEEIMEIRAREGTALDDLAEAKEGLKEFFRELAEPGEPEPCCPCCPLREEEWLKRQEEWLWDDWCDYVDYELDPARGILDND